MATIFETFSIEISRQVFSSEHNTEHQECVGLYTTTSSPATQCLKDTDLPIMTKCGLVRNEKALRNTDSSQLPAYKVVLDCLLCTDETCDSMNTAEDTFNASPKDVSTQTDLSLISDKHAIDTCYCNFLLSAKEDERVDKLLEFATTCDHRLPDLDTFGVLDTLEGLSFLEDLDHRVPGRTTPAISFLPMHTRRTPVSLACKLSFTAHSQSLASDLPLRMTADASLSHIRWTQSLADLNQHLARYPRFEKTPPKAVRASLDKLSSPYRKPAAKPTKCKQKRNHFHEANEAGEFRTKRVLFATC